MTLQEEDELIDEYQPEPLVIQSEMDSGSNARRELIVDGMAKTKMMISGEEKLNLASFNMLGLVGDEQIQAATIKAARRYGIGSCGPRGFYGTIDCHLELEEKFAKFVGSEEAIIYSYGFSTIASVIPAYCKRGDVIFYDKGVALATQKGELARARILSAS